MSVRHSFMVQDSKVSFEYVDFYTKMSLILDAAFENQKTKWILMYTLKILSVKSELQTISLKHTNVGMTF